MPGMSSASLAEAEVFPHRVVHGAAGRWEAGGDFFEGFLKGKFFGQDVLAGGVEVADDNALIVVHVRGTAAFGAAVEEVGVKTGEDEELIRALHVKEELVVAAGVLDGLEVINAVKTVDAAVDVIGAFGGGAAEVGANDGHVVGHGDLGDAELLQGVTDDDEEEELRREHGGLSRDEGGVEKLVIVEDDGNSVRVIQHGIEAFSALFIVGQSITNKIPIRGSETEPAAGAWEARHIEELCAVLYK